jgi:hypothetical protein
MKRLRKGRLIFAVSACLLVASCRHHVAAAAPSTIVTGPVVLPPGTVLALIAAETIDTTQPSANRAYAAVISRDIAHGEPQRILPSGSPATIVLMPAEGADSSRWQLGLSSIMLNGDSYLVKNSESGAPLGTFLGGVPGRDYSDPSKRKPDEPVGLIVSESSIHILPGSLLTFRLEKEVTLAGSAH